MQIIKDIFWFSIVKIYYPLDINDDIAFYNGFYKLINVLDNISI